MTGKRNQTAAALAFQQRRAKRAVANRQHETQITPKEGKMNTLVKVLTLVVIFALLTMSCGAVAFVAFRYGANQSNPTEVGYNTAPDPKPTPATATGQCDTAWASTTFGGDPAWWESTAEGSGCHLIEQHERVYITVPVGYAMEAYYDQNPGRDPYQMVAQGPTKIWIQGGTIWPNSGTNVWCAMLHQKYPGLKFSDVAKLIDAIGFSKPKSCD